MTSDPQTFRIDLEPIGRRIEVPDGLSLLEAAQQAGVDLVAACGGMGICGTCRVRLLQGPANPLTPSEEEQLSPAQLAEGSRLACQCQPHGDIKVDVPPESLPAPQKIQTEGRQQDFALHPPVLPLDLAVPPPSLSDLRSDWTRLQAALPPGSVSLSANLDTLAQLSSELRRSDWQVRLALSAPAGRLAGSFAPHTPLLGLAVDLGSTKLAVYLVNLETGVTLAQTGVMNPQISYGEDVINRIAFANKSPENRRMLQRRVVEALAESAAELCRKAKAVPGQIVEAVVVGNTAMHHFFTHLPVVQLGAAPYVAAASQPLSVTAAELGLPFAPGAQVYLPANIAGYVGGDHTAALLACHTFPGRAKVLVDIGTNTEISLLNGEEIYTCSTASGPAFEGAHIHDGMRAAPGAIERVCIQADGRPQVWTIGGQAAVGICGSGILQGVAELCQTGLIDSRGALKKGAPRVRAGEKGPEYLLVEAARSGHGRDIVITRRDVNEIQLAKGAIRAGIELILRKAALTPSAVEAWIIAGAFGSYLDLSSAVRVGLFPDQPLERFHQVGNAAGVGARQMLLSLAERDQAARLAARAAYVELTTEQAFTEEFMRAMYL